MNLSGEEHAEQAELLLREVEQDLAQATTPEDLARPLIMAVMAGVHATLATVFDE